MKALYKPLSVCLFSALFPGFLSSASAQCGAGTPSFTVDLSGKPDSVWYSTSVARADTCCASSNCVEFVVKVDASVTAIKLDIVSGAIPTGSLFYKIDCGSSTSVGQPLCLPGTGGPYRITFCKPGNNSNIYRLTPITRPKGPETVTVSEGCRATLHAIGFIDSTIVWKSLSGSAYDSYLSCKTGCDSTVVSPTGSFPTYVDYQVCGKPACQSITVCDTVRVFFVKDLVVTVPAPGILCHNDTAAYLSASASGGKAPYIYLWSTGATGANIYARPGAYWVRVLDQTQCGPETTTVVVQQVPGAPVAHAGNDTTICAKSIAGLRGSLQNVPGGYWVGPGTFSPSKQDINATYTPTAGEIAAGESRIWLVTSDSSGCPADSDEVVITLIREPEPVIAGASLLCGGTTGTSYFTTSIPGNTYTWTVTGGTIASGQGTNVILINWGYGDNGTVNLTETNPTGCSTSVQKTIKLLRKARPLISGPDSACEQSGGHIYSVASETGSVYLWAVAGGTLLSGQGSGTITVNWGASGNGTIHLKQTIGGCDTTVKKEVWIMPKPVPMVQGPANVCQYEAPETYFTSGSAGSAYAWSVSGGVLVENSGNTVRVQWGKAGTGKIIVQERNAYGCINTASADVIIHGKPLIGIIGDTSVCEFSTHNYTPFDTAQPVSEWLTDGGILVDDNGKKQLITWGAAGIGTVRIRQVTWTGCDTTSIKSVIINGRPQPFINGKDTVCENTLHTYEIGFTPGHTYKWYVANGTITGVSDNPKVTVKWNSAGTGTILLRETNMFGCDSMVAAKVLITPYPEPDIDGRVKVCENSGPFTYVSPANTGNTYAWSVAGGIITGSSTLPSVEVSWLAEGKGTLVLRETSPTGCSAYDTFIVDIQRLNIGMSREILYPCNPSPVRFRLTADDTLLSILWVFGDGATSGELEPEHRYESPGTYTVKLYATSITGCVDSATTTVTIYPNPNAQFDVFYPRPDRVFYNLEDTVQFTNRSSGGTRYEWDFGDSVTSTHFSPRHMYKKPGNYPVKLKAWNELGCVDSIIINVFVDAHIIVLPPNVFTPTGDGLNEGFSVPMFNIQSLNVQIFNRWGERVYESNDLHFRWDGRFKGEYVQQDVYVYVIRARTVSGEVLVKKGDVTVLR